MKFMSSLDPKDRRLLLWSIAVAIGLAVIIGVVMPNENNDDNPMPSTYLSGQHGARAAYESLLRSGYNIERWERPLSELAATAGPNTVIIFARPFTRETEDINAVQQIVERGGRVLATGLWGGSTCFPKAMSEHQKNLISLPADWKRKVSMRWPEAAKSGWCLRPHGRRTILAIAPSTAAPRNRLWWSTTTPTVMWCGGPGSTPLENGSSPALRISICCLTPSGRATDITFTGMSLCTAMLSQSGATFQDPPSPSYGSE